MTLSNIGDKLQGAAQSAAPYMTGGAVGGALGAGALGLTSLLTKNKLETPEQRRKRILRNTLVGGGFGAAAGVALPLSADLVQGGIPDKTEARSMLDRLGEIYRPGSNASSAAARTGYAAGGLGAGTLAHMVRGNTSKNRTWSANLASDFGKSLTETTGNIDKAVRAKMEELLNTSKGKKRGKGTVKAPSATQLGGTSPVDALMKMFETEIKQTGSASTSGAPPKATAARLRLEEFFKSHRGTLESALREGGQGSGGMNALVDRVKREFPNARLGEQRADPTARLPVTNTPALARAFDYLKQIPNSMWDGVKAQLPNNPNRVKNMDTEAIRQKLLAYSQNPSALQEVLRTSRYENTHGKFTDTNGAWQNPRRPRLLGAGLAGGAFMLPEIIRHIAPAVLKTHEVIDGTTN